eukprot:8960948-Lingulodinium_polyedra.AAC.1
MAKPVVLWGGGLPNAPGRGHRHAPTSTRATGSDRLSRLGWARSPNGKRHARGRRGANKPTTPFPRCPC